MIPSIFTDELGIDITQGLPIIKSWGLNYVDLRGLVFGRATDSLGVDQLKELKALLEQHSLKVGCLQSSLAKVHLPDKERQQAEAKKLERIIIAAEILDCPLVRSFHYWQPEPAQRGAIATQPDQLQNVLEIFWPLAQRAKEAGLILGFENCGVLPDEVFAVLDALNVPAWGLAWDVNNTWDSDERRRDEDVFIERMLKRANMLHVKARGALSRYEDEVIPYEKVLRRARDAKLSGPVSVETHQRGSSEEKTEVSKEVVNLLKDAWPGKMVGAFYTAGQAQAEITRPWNDDPVGFVVVGLGMGHNRAGLIKETPGTRLVGVCDLDEARCKRSSETYGVPYKTDLNEWLQDDNVEVVYVLTATGLHARIALQAMEAGKHVITTKPMEASLDACDAMIRKADEKGVLLAVDFARRYGTDLNTLKACINQGHFGQLLSGHCTLKILRTMEYFQRNNGWRGTRALDGGGVLSNQSIHHIDELAFTVGVPNRVRCSLWTQNHAIEAEDLGSAIWEYENGLVITFTATTSYPHKTWYVSTELQGTEGAYSYFAGGPFEQPQTRWYLDGSWRNYAPKSVAVKWLNAADNFAAALRAGEPLTCDGRDGRRTQSILDAMYRSAYDNHGNWVTVAETI